MTISTTPTKLQQLLQQSAKNAQPSIVFIAQGYSGGDFLMKRVIERLEVNFAKQFQFYCLAEDSAKAIQAELKATKSPVVLVLERAEIQLLYSGMTPYETLREVLTSYLEKNCENL